MATVTATEQRYLDLSQAVGAELLHAFDDACRAAGIDYIIFAGTLLGAVREGGWIPWDDDIDVAMTRDDFERFRLVAEDHLPAFVRFSDTRTDPAHITAIPRLLHLRTTREPAARTRKTTPPESQHVPLDIFILDRPPLTKRAQRLWRARIRLLEKLVLANGTRARDVLAAGGSPVKKAVELLGVLVAKTASGPTWRRRHCDVSAAHAASGSPYLCSSNDFKIATRGVLLPESSIKPTTTMTFDGRTVQGPKDASAVLAQLYGPAYLTPPPASEQRPLHFRSALSAVINGQSFEVRPD